MLKVHLKSTVGCRTNEDFDKAVKPFSSEERVKIAGMLLQARDMGYYPEAITDNGIEWGIATKSDVQVEMERHAEKYWRRGEDIRGNCEDIFGVSVFGGVTA